MPPGLPLLIPEGWPTIAQRFNVGCAGLDGHKSRQGRLNPCKIGQSSFHDLSCCGRWFPTCVLKRWAILACPYWTKACTGFSGLLWDQILVKLDIPLLTPAHARLRTKMSALRKTLRMDSHRSAHILVRFSRRRTHGCGQKCPRSAISYERTLIGARIFLSASHAGARTVADKNVRAPQYLTNGLS